VPSPLQQRLDLAIQNLESKGFAIVEGECLRGSKKHVSANAKKRAQELMAYLMDNSIAAVIPPWGGELAIELLPLLDFEAISTARPKWILGYSDISTLLSAITTKCGWATAHGANLMELIEAQTDKLTSLTLDNLGVGAGNTIVQHSSAKYQKAYIDFASHPNAPLNLTEPTEWKILGSKDHRLQFSGRILGGCLDILTDLVGSEYLDLSSEQLAANDEKIILYLENVEMSPTALARALHGIMFRVPTERISGVLMGRNAAASIDSEGFSDIDAITSVFSGFDFPVVYDVDIGHLPPNMLVINGSLATVEFLGGAGTLTQALV